MKLDFFVFSTNNPQVFEAAIAPLAGDLKVEPARSSDFNSKVSVKPLSKLAIFTVRADSIRVNIEPPHDYVGLHMPLGRNLAITENRRKTLFGQDIHLLKPNRELSLEAREGCRVLVTNVYSESLQAYALKLTAHLTRPISRANLAAAAGVSIRALSRGFVRRHGTGPKGFLKARRMAVAYRELLGAEAGSTRVCEVATRYGANHLGKFAVEYKQTFGESPSVTLSH